MCHIILTILVTLRVNLSFILDIYRFCTSGQRNCQPNEQGLLGLAILYCVYSQALNFVLFWIYLSEYS